MLTTDCCGERCGEDRLKWHHDRGLRSARPRLRPRLAGESPACRDNGKTRHGPSSRRRRRRAKTPAHDCRASAQASRDRHGERREPLALTDVAQRLRPAMCNAKHAAPPTVSTAISIKHLRCPVHKGLIASASSSLLWLAGELAHRSAGRQHRGPTARLWARHRHARHRPHRVTEPWTGSSSPL